MPSLLHGTAEVCGYGWKGGEVRAKVWRQEKREGKSSRGETLKLFNDTILKQLKAVFVTASFFTCLGCSGNAKWVERLEGEDFSLVEKGRVPYATRKIDSPSEFDDLINKTRRAVEENPKVMEKIARTFYTDIPEDLVFQYDFSSLDNQKERVVLRYFAKYSEPQVFSGIVLQFVVDIKTKEVSGIYILQIPLE